MHPITSLTAVREHRDEQILLALEAGETQADLARRSNLSQAAVSTAAHRAARRLGRSVPRQPRRWSVAPSQEVTG